MPKLIDLTGKIFSRLEVVGQAGKNKWGAYKWLCLCDCGNKIVVLDNNIKSGRTKSCGCLNKEVHTKHGHARRGKETNIYHVWQQIVQRCVNPSNNNYEDYGGRGIVVCKQWLKFENFLEDMGKGWELGLTIDRRNNDKGYCKKNCRWITNKEQQMNKRNSCCVLCRGKRWLFMELCKEYNIPYKVVYSRYYTYRWTLEESLTTPVRKRRKK